MEKTYTECLSQAQDAARQIKAARPQWDLEMTGSWLWIHGTEKADKEGRELLKSLGCRWSPNKECWYLKGQDCVSHGGVGMDYIRLKYGSMTIDERAQVAA